MYQRKVDVDMLNAVNFVALALCQSKECRFRFYQRRSASTSSTNANKEKENKKKMCLLLFLKQLRESLAEEKCNVAKVTVA